MESAWWIVLWLGVGSIGTLVFVALAILLAVLWIDRADRAELGLDGCVNDPPMTAEIPLPPIDEPEFKGGIPRGWNPPYNFSDTVVRTRKPTAHGTRSRKPKSSKPKRPSRKSPARKRAKAK